MNHLVCKSLESGSPFCVALSDLGCNSPNKIPPWGGSSPSCQPIRCRPCPGGAVPLQSSSSSRNASGFCCWQGVLGDACSAPAICALGYPLNHGDLHGNLMRPGISVPLCIKQHQLPCNLIVCVLNINQQTVGWSRANSSPGMEAAPADCPSGETWPIPVSLLPEDAPWRKFRLWVFHLDKPPLWGP